MQASDTNHKATMLAILQAGMPETASSSKPASTKSAFSLEISASTKPFHSGMLSLDPKALISASLAPQSASQLISTTSFWQLLWTIV